jgi:hypothetical protein
MVFFGIRIGSLIAYLGDDQVIQVSYLDFENSVLDVIKNKKRRLG